MRVRKGNRWSLRFDTQVLLLPRWNKIKMFNTEIMDNCFFHTCFPKTSLWQIQEGHHGRALPVQILSFSCSFRQFGKNVRNNRLSYPLGSWRPLGNPKFAAGSVIFYWNVVTTDIVTFWSTSLTLGWYRILGEVYRVTARPNSWSEWGTRCITSIKLMLGSYRWKFQ